MRGEAFPDSLEGVALGGESDRRNRAVAEGVGDGDVAVRLHRAGRPDGQGVTSLRRHHLKNEVGPVAQVAEDAPALLFPEIPVIGRHLVPGDEPVIHGRARLRIEAALDLAPDSTVRTIKAERHLALRALHRGAQADQLIFVDDMRLLYVNVLPTLQRLDGILGVRRMIRGDEDEVY